MPYKPILIVHIAVVLVLQLGLSVSSAQDIEFKQSKQAKAAFIKYRAACLKLAAESRKAASEINDLAASSRAKLNKIFVAELEKIQEEETTSGKLDAALEVRTAIESFSKPLKKSLSPEQMRESITGTVWQYVKGHYFRFNDDGTITTSWHKDPCMWAVLPNGQIQMIVRHKSREPFTMSLDGNLKSGTLNNGATIRRLK